MKRNLSRALAVVAPAVVLCAGTSFGQYLQSSSSSYYAGTGEGKYFSVTDSKEMLDKNAPAKGAASSCGCNSCCDNGCNSCCDDCCNDVCVDCEDCPTVGAYYFTNFESWRGISDGSFQNNNGIRTGLNVGSTIGDSLVGWQLGGSYGAYDFNGRQSAPDEASAQQEQFFITTGFFRRAGNGSNWSGGLVYDMMINDNWGVFSDEPYLTQWRGQMAYALSACNEIGVWGTMRDRGDSQVSNLFGGTTRYRAVEQYNLFWHHNYECGADSWIWMGVVNDDDSLAATGGTYDWTLGGRFIAPMTDYWALTGDLQYVNPSSPTGPIAAREDAWFVSFGLVYFPGGAARNRSVAGRCSIPYMPVANNGNFVVDSNRTF